MKNIAYAVKYRNIKYHLTLTLALYTSIPIYLYINISEVGLYIAVTTGWTKEAKLI